MAKCKICEKTVVTAHVFHRECWQDMAYAQMCVDDAADDPEIVYTKEKMDRALRAACGENIRPFEERYAIENLYFREKLKEKKKS